MTPYWTNGVATLHQADARALPVADGSVHCVITSPPYWGLRDYGLSDWEGGDPECDHQRRNPIAHATDGRPRELWRNHNDEPPAGGVCGYCGARQQEAGIGLEPTLSEWLVNIVAVGREVWRVLRDDGTWWLNLGDAYAGSGKGSGGPNQQSNQGSLTGRRHNALIRSKRNERGPGSGKWNDGGGYAVDGLPAKSLMMQPARAALALQDDGWILRSEIVWHKPNPMPESVSDRPTSAHEKVYLLTKQGRYFYDAEAVRQPYSESSASDKRDNRNGNRRALAANPPGMGQDNGGTNLGGNRAGGANLRNVWQIPTQGRPEAHFATFPDELPRRCILACTSEHGVCANCGAPWVRMVEKSFTKSQEVNSPRQDGGDAKGRANNFKKDGYGAGSYDVQTLGWQPTCDCNAGRVPATVLDPFVGRGTTIAVAQQLGRRGIGTDLNPEYLGIARKTLEKIPLPMEMLL